MFNCKTQFIASLIVLGTLTFAVPLSAQESFVSVESAEKINSANELVRQGEFDQAIEEYQQVTPNAADRDELNYNQAVAQFRRGDIQSAQAMFTESATSADTAIAASSRYNLGNCVYSTALKTAEKDKPTAVEQLREAISQYRDSLRLSSDNVDARANIELAADTIRKLQEEQKQEEQQKQDQQQDQNQQSQDQQDSQSEQDQDQKQDQQNQSEESKSDQKNSDQQQSKNEQSKNEQSKNEQSKNEQSKNEQSDSQDQKSQQEQQSKQNQSSGEQLKENESDSDKPQQNGQQNDSQKDKSKDGQSKDEQSKQDATDQQSQPQQSDGEQTDSQDQQQKEQQADQQPKSSANNQSRQNQQQPDQQSTGEPQSDEQVREEEKGNSQVPAGELSAAGTQDENGKPTGSVAMADPNAKDGLMTKEEAMKMLQAVRDRDMLRRLRQEQLERSRHVPVDKDW